MRDFETAIAMNTNNVLNVQQKKQFDLADVDNNEMKLEVIIANYKSQMFNEYE